MTMQEPDAGQVPGKGNARKRNRALFKLGVVLLVLVPVTSFLIHFVQRVQEAAARAH